MKPLTNKDFSYAYCLVSAIGIAAFLYLNFIHRALPYDDAYSISMIRVSYTDVYSLTASDVHPPLYYWLLKVYSSIFGDSMFSLRNFSLLGFVATLFLGYFPIRRIFGNGASLTFCVLLFLFPVSQYLASDIRMYSWALFSVLAAALYAYDAYDKGRFVDWSKFFIAGLGAAYLHNYALLAIAGIYILLLFVVFRSGKRWGLLVACGLSFALLYMPWIGHLIYQMNDVKQGYWIEPLTYKDILLHAYYMYSPKETWLPFTWYSKYQMMVYLLVLMSLQLWLTVRYFGNKSFVESRKRLSILSFVVFVFPLFIGLLVSITYAPVLVPRYMLCAFGLFVLGLAVLLSDMYGVNKLQVCAFLLMLLSCAVLRSASGYNYYMEVKKEYAQIHEFVNEQEVGIPFLSVDACHPALCRMQVLSVGHQCFIVSDSVVCKAYQPFLVNVLSTADAYPPDFISVHSISYDRSTDMSTVDCYNVVRDLEKQHYYIADSLRTSEFALYRVSNRAK